MAQLLIDLSDVLDMAVIPEAGIQNHAEVTVFLDGHVDGVCWVPLDDLPAATGSGSG